MHVFPEVLGHIKCKKSLQAIRKALLHLTLNEIKSFQSFIIIPNDPSI